MDTKQVKTYVYDQNVITQVVMLLEKVEIKGTSQATILATIGEYINKPIKEDVVDLEV